MHLSQILAEVICFQHSLHEDQPLRYGCKIGYYYCRHKTRTCWGLCLTRKQKL